MIREIYLTCVCYTKEGKITVPQSVMADTAFLYELSDKAQDTPWRKNTCLEGISF